MHCSNHSTDDSSSLPSFLFVSTSFFLILFSISLPPPSPRLSLYILCVCISSILQITCVAFCTRRKSDFSKKSSNIFIKNVHFILQLYHAARVSLILNTLLIAYLKKKRYSYLLFPIVNNDLTDNFESAKHSKSDNITHLYRWSCRLKPRSQRHNGRNSCPPCSHTVRSCTSHVPQCIRRCLAREGEWHNWFRLRSVSMDCLLHSSLH